LDALILEWKIHVWCYAHDIRIFYCITRVRRMNTVIVYAAANYMKNFFPFIGSDHLEVCFREAFVSFNFKHL